MAPVRIVPATAADVPVILDLIRGLAEYEKLLDRCVATEDALRETLFGERPAAEILLARADNGDCSGFALFFTNYSTFLARPGIYLEDLFVRPQYRGQGIGFALLQKLAQLAVARNCGRVEWSVLNWNTPSIDFYRRLGAVPMDDWTMYRLTGEALQKMGKVIA